LLKIPIFQGALKMLPSNKLGSMSEPIRSLVWVQFLEGVIVIGFTGVKLSAVRLRKRGGRSDFSLDFVKAVSAILQGACRNVLWCKHLWGMWWLYRCTIAWGLPVVRRNSRSGGHAGHRWCSRWDI